MYDDNIFISFKKVKVLTIKYGWIILVTLLLGILIVVVNQKNNAANVLYQGEMIVKIHTDNLQKVDATEIQTVELLFSSDEFSKRFQNVQIKIDNIMPTNALVTELYNINIISNDSILVKECAEKILIEFREYYESKVEEIDTEIYEELKVSVLTDGGYLTTTNIVIIIMVLLLGFAIWFILLIRDDKVYCYEELKQCFGYKLYGKIKAKDSYDKIQSLFSMLELSIEEDFGIVKIDNVNSRKFDNVNACLDNIGVITSILEDRNSLKKCKEKSNVVLVIYQGIDRKKMIAECVEYLDNIKTIIKGIIWIED